MPWLASPVVPTATVLEIVRLVEAEAAAARAATLSGLERTRRQTCCTSGPLALVRLVAARKVRVEFLARTRMVKATRDEVLARVAEERARESVSDSIS